MQNNALIALLAELAQNGEPEESRYFEICDQIWPYSGPGGPVWALRVHPVWATTERLYRRVPSFWVSYAGDWEIEIEIESTYAAPNKMPLHYLGLALAASPAAAAPPHRVGTWWSRATRSAVRLPSEHGHRYAIPWDAHTMARLLVAMVAAGGRVERLQDARPPWPR